MATIVVGFVGVFKDLGTSAAVIQRKGFSEALLHSLFWVNVAFGLLSTMLFFLIAPLIAGFYREPIIAPLLRVLSLTFFISGISILQQALLEKELAFNTLAKIEVSSVAFGSFIGIGSAMGGLGVWSLIYQTIAVTTLTTFLLWKTTNWQPKLIFSFQELKAISSYSSNLTGFNVFNYLIRNFDYLLIGKFIGAEALGFYTLAYRTILYPLQSISGVISRVGFPVFSQLQDDNVRLRSAYLRVVAMIAIVTFPLMLGIWVLAEPFILIVLGEKWKASIPIILVLAPVGLVQSVVTTVGTIYQSKGRTDWMFCWSLFAGVLVICGFVLGLRWNIIGVAAGYAIASLILVYPSFAIPFRLINLSMARFAAVLWRPLMCSAIMSCLILGIQAVLPMSFSPALNLGISILLGGATYVVVSQWINHDQMRQLFNLLGLIE